MGQLYDAVDDLRIDRAWFSALEDRPAVLGSSHTDPKQRPDIDIRETADIPALGHEGLEGHAPVLSETLHAGNGEAQGITFAPQDDPGHPVWGQGDIFLTHGILHNVRFTSQSAESPSLRRTLGAGSVFMRHPSVSVPSRSVR